MLANLGVLMLPVVAVPTVSKLFDASGSLTDERARHRLTGLGAQLARTIARLG
jgi:hypothetical protein